MKLVLDRIFKGEDYTIGKLYIDGEFICDTLEDRDRGLKQTDSLEKIQFVKVYGKTAIPTGTYNIDISIVSPKFKDKVWSKPFDGKLPRLIDVPGYEGVLIHVGNKPEDTLGCILVGDNKIKGQVINSTARFNQLMSKLQSIKETITIIIK